MENKAVFDCKTLTYGRGLKHTEETKRKMRETHLREKNPNWNGGTRKTKDGIMINCPNHPRADNMGYVKRCTLMAEEALGRYLKPNELVHHINFDCFDDRNENFLICKIGYHMGLHNKIRHRRLKPYFQSLCHKPCNPIQPKGGEDD